jgi:hypothetical protein
MTNIGVFSKPYQTEDRSWLLTELEDAFKLSGTLDITTLTKATHYANYYVPSGLVVGKVTASGLYGPYDDTAVDGRQTAVGYLAVGHPRGGPDVHRAGEGRHRHHRGLRGRQHRPPAVQLG